MTDIRSRLADALRESLAPWITGFCSGAEIDVDEDYLLSLIDELSDEITGELLSLSGIAITVLPEPTDEERTDWESPGRGVWINPITGFVRFQTNQFAADEARALAGALLAAAAQAQGQQQ